MSAWEENFPIPRAGGGGAGYDAIAYQMIKSAISADAVDAGYMLANRRAVLDQLVFNLEGLEIESSTIAELAANEDDKNTIQDNASYLIFTSTVLRDVFYPDWSYDLGSASYSSKSFSVGAQDTSPVGLAFSPDGSTMFIVGGANDTVYQYTLSTPWDVSTASYASKSFSVSSQESVPYCLAFSPDGSTMFIGGANGTVFQYTLSTPWDVSTASYASKSFSVGAQDTTPLGLAFSPDGSTMFIGGGANDTVYQYTLSTPWDVSTASYASKSFSVGAQDSIPYGLTFSPDGLKMFVVGSSNDTVYQYTLSTPWDVSTASYASKSFSVSAQDTAPSGLAFTPDGLKMFVVGSSNDTVYQYNTPAP